MSKVVEVYNEYEINVCKEESLAGYDVVYYYAMRLSDGYFLVDSYTLGNDTISYIVDWLKKVVDSPEEYGYEKE